MNARRLWTAVLVMAVADLIVGLITGGPTPLPLGSVATLAGLLVRAGLIAILALVHYAVWGPRTAERRAWLVLGLLLLPTAVQFQLAGGRINGDGIMYYVYVRSLMKDGDLDFTNEYTHYEMAERDDLVMLTDTGRRRSIFAAGPGVAWTPFFAVGEGVARAHRAIGAEVDLSGYGPHHRNAVALGSLLYGFATIALIHSMLKRHFDVAIALGASLLIWGATFLPWYMVQQPMMAHAVSAAGAALVIWIWDRGRGTRGLAGFAGLGLLIGFAMCLRWQNGVLLVLPAVELFERARRRDLSLARSAQAGLLMAIGLLVGAVPQMLAWKYIYGAYLLPYPPHGADFLRLDHPYLLQTLFSSRHGLLSWTPVFWLGFLGFVPLVKQRPSLALPLLAPLVLMTYVNACSGDWWAGAAFSNRRFDSQLAIFAVGFAASLEWLRRWIVQHPNVVPAALAMACLLWNVGVAAEARQGRLDSTESRTFPALVGANAARLAEPLGSPPTWPASWLFAARYRLPPGQYDRLVGRYLFYRQNNLRGRIDLGVPGDEAMIDGGWGPAERHDGVSARRVPRSARMFAPLDVPEDLGVRVRTAVPAGTAVVAVRVNGQEAGRFEATAPWCEHEVYAAAALWRRELNEVRIDVSEPGAYVDQVNFIRQPVRP